MKKGEKVPEYKGQLLLIYSLYIVINWEICVEMHWEPDSGH